MGNPVIPIGKKRYTITLTEEHAERFKRFLKDNKGPANLFSIAIDEFVTSMSINIIPMTQRAIKEGKPLRIGDLLKATFDSIDDASKQGNLL